MYGAILITIMAGIASRRPVSRALFLFEGTHRFSVIVIALDGFSRLSIDRPETVVPGQFRRDLRE